MNKWKFLDVCAGIGGLSRPLHIAGAECVLMIERDKFARKTYDANYVGVPFTQDVTDIDLSFVPDHDILLAGFPCQPFSSSGLQLGFHDTRGTVFFDIMRIIKARQPKLVLMENVRNILHHDKGKTFRVITQTMIDAGYDFQWREVNAAAFVPQQRRRIFMVGQLHSKCSTLVNINSFPVPPPPYGPAIGSILHGDETQEHPLDGDRFYSHRFAEVNKKYTLSPRLHAWLLAHKAKQQDRGGMESVNFINPSDLSATLTARYYKDGKEIILHPHIRGRAQSNSPRKLTPRECARLMGFPESFILPSHVSDTQLYKQLGNSVVPQCAAVFLDGLLAHHNP